MKNATVRLLLTLFVLLMLLASSAPSPARVQIVAAKNSHESLGEESEFEVFLPQVQKSYMMGWDAQPASTINDIGYPFPCGQTWRVFQGYNGPTHKNYYVIDGGIDQRYAFDLVKDVGDTAGAEVLAAASGTVTIWVPDDGGAQRGKDVFIHLSDGKIIYNAHLTDLRVSRGQWVNKGDPIGVVFNYPDPSDEKPNHLHFHVGTRPQSLPLNFGVWNFPSPGPVGNGEWSGSKVEYPCSSIPPTADAGGPYTAHEGEAVILNASGSSDPDGGIVSYEWDLDGDGEYDDATGQTPTWTWNDDYNGNIGLRVTDDDGATGVATAAVTILNVAPTVDAGSDQTVFRNDVVALAGVWTDPAGNLDELYGWTWDVTADGIADHSGSVSYGSVASVSASFATEGVYTLTFAVVDKDGGTGSDSVTVEVLNRPPDCSAATPSIKTIWPPNKTFKPIRVRGVTDPEDDSISITIDSIRQDEPVDTVGDGTFTPDGRGVGTDIARVRAERFGSEKWPGNGRVYHIRFTADDGHGGSCSGKVLVEVPFEEDGAPAVDDGALYDSTVWVPPD